MDQQKIGKFISQKRKEKNLTQAQLGDKLHISKNAVSKWERGICMMDIALLEPLSQILGVSVTELLNGEEKPFDNEEYLSVKNTLEIAENQIKNYDRLIQFTLIVIILAQLIWPYMYESVTGGNFYEIYYIVYPLPFLFYVILYLRSAIKQKKLSWWIIIIIILSFFHMIVEMELSMNILSWL